MVPQRAGDPLGLGITPETRPPAPPDPDTYDQNRENVEYARSLLDKEERAQVDAEIEKEGFMPIHRVRDIIASNTAKGSIEAGGIDPEIMTLIDTRIDYKIFVAGDNIYTREGLYDHFPFHEFGVQPEAIFVQQEIGIFPPRKHAMKDDFEYIARDVGDESVDFIMIEDLVGQATRADYNMKRAPLRIVKTKIYIGKERWDDFALLQRFFRGAARIVTAQIAYNGGGVPPLFAMLTGQGSGPPPPLIADESTLEAERQERVRREEELRRREEELRRREEEQRRRDEEVQKRIDADLRRIETMLAAMTGFNRGAGAHAPVTTGTASTARAGPQLDDGEDDSVPL